MSESQTQGLIYSAIIGAVIFLVLWILMEFFRARRAHIFLYRKYLVENEDKYPEWHNENGDFCKEVKPEPSKKMLGWFTASQSVSPEEIQSQVGYDARMMLFSINNKFLYFLLVGVLSAIVLIPVYATADGATVGVVQLTTANIPKEQQQRLWATFAMDLVVMFLTLSYIFREVRVYARVRDSYRREVRGANYAIAVQDIPSDMRSPEKMRELFESAFPGQVEGVQLVYTSKKMTKQFNLYFKALNKRELAEYKWLNSEDDNGELQRPRHHEKPCTCCCSGTVDSIEYWTDEQNKLYGEIVDEQNKMDGDVIAKSASAIVIFRDKGSAPVATLSQHVLFNAPVSQYTITRIEAPQAVHWPGIRKNRTQGIIWTVVLWAVIVVVTFFWVPITVAVMSLANLEALAEVPALSFLQPILNVSPAVTALISGFLPPVVAIVLGILPVMLITMFCTFERHPSIGQLEIRQRNLVFMFQFLTQFLFIVVAGTGLQELAGMLEDPQSIVPLLAEGIPAQSTFYLNLVLTSCFISNGMALCSIVRLIVVPILRKLMPTPRGFKNALHFGGSFGYAGMYQTTALIGSIGIVYSTMAPLIPLFCAFFFMITYIVSKYNILYTQHSALEHGGGMFWGHLQITYIAVYIKTLTMIGVYGVNEAPGPAAVSVILLLATAYAHWYMNQKYRPICYHGTVESSSRANDADPKWVPIYRTPELRNPKTEVPQNLELPQLAPKKEGDDSPAAKTTDYEAGEGETADDFDNQQFYDSRVDENIEGQKSGGAVV